MALTNGFWAKVKSACKSGKKASQDKASAKCESRGNKAEEQIQERSRQISAHQDCDACSVDSVTSTLSISSWFSSPTMRNICTISSSAESYRSGMSSSTTSCTFSQHQEEARTWRPQPPPLKQLS
mmetsp:Transcript_5437/g.7146  ORF Transcript_5437/g.7146 Transcript_5437/m.7146 type:complete len:125 (+) Transcript_5437:39-413(+)